MLFTCLNLQDEALVIGRKGDGQDKQVLHKMVAFGRGLPEATNELWTEPSLEKTVPLPGRRSGRVQYVVDSGLVHYFSGRCGVTEAETGPRVSWPRLEFPCRREPAAASDAVAVPAAPGDPRAPPQPPFPAGQAAGGLTAAALHRATRGPRRDGAPPRVKHESPPPARGCCLGTPWATATPAQGRRRPPVRSCLFKRRKTRPPPGGKCPPAPRRARAGSGAGRPLPAARGGGSARRLRPQEMAAARGEAGGDPSWRRGAPAAPLRRSVSSALPAAGLGSRGRPAGGGRAAAWRLAELASVPRRRPGAASCEGGMAVFALAPLAGHVKAARSDPAAARGGICRRDMHLAWKCPRPLPCRGWRRGASARSPFPGAAGPWVPLFPAPGLGEEGRWPC